MFIPSTKGGILTKMMRDNEIEMVKITRFRVKFQEAGGIQLARLFSTDPAKGESYQREDCPPCSSKEENKTGSKQQSILYKSRCAVCNVQIGVITTMNTHQYSFNGKTFLQMAGGPIDLRVTCAAACIVMNAWDSGWLEVMEQSGLQIKTGVRCMDDIFIFANAIKEGWR
jgi:hypothetical protein